MSAGLDIDLAWEVEAALAFHDEDAKAAIAALLCDIKELRRQLKSRPAALRSACRLERPTAEGSYLESYITSRRGHLQSLAV